ncbi:MAG: peptidoglycan DD-metalloendopeptidase family protein [Spirochaetota bacterium]
MKKYILIAFLAAVLLSLIPVIAHIRGTDATQAPDEIDLIENAIIIDGLSMEGSAPPEENAEILYDDSFVEEEKDVKNIIASHKGAETNPSREADIMRDLLKKDRRWHLSPYTVKKGDNLWTIAEKFGSSHKLIIKINGITKSGMLKPGSRLKIPNRNGVEYTIVKGDTVSGIAKKFRKSSREIRSFHGSGNAIKAGDVFFIPDASPACIVRSGRPKPLRSQPRVTPKDSDAVAVIQKAVETKKAVCSNFVWPVKGRITSGFGKRTDPFSRKRKFHNGIDISAEIGTPVRSTAGGTVIFSGWKDGYGKLVVVRHEKGFISVYGHNSELKKKEGDSVAQGEVIALSGMTGAVTGAHVHFEIQKYQTPCNPLRMMK